ncbi:Rha family transcriptional regulator [Oceanobacillus oncorhynchi]|uniref:Rha family transcriptional regulator n=1 Tax=Oceanobacillus oncorhynchi TaxID=545501 RepID=UPI001868CEFC|nr:Rha family transcriptional regulator [Oceanobacillus oncorhynchi]
MNQLKVISHNGQLVTESREVAKMINKEHKILLRDIRKYIEYMGTKMNPSKFFIESYYQDAYGRNKVHFLLTRKGCDMVANKMTGEKGVLFTAEYVTRFEEMEQKLQQPNDLVTNYLSMSEEDRAIAFFNSQKEKKQIEQQRQEELPYTNFGKAVSNSSAAINIGAFSKLMYEAWHQVRPK